jgi:mRNA-degrading endonuclease toxin of MazEF toxin-antitoxin module
VRRGEVWWHEPPDSKRRPVLTERITTLGPEKMAAVCSALATATSCR